MYINDVVQKINDLYILIKNNNFKIRTSVYLAKGILLQINHGNKNVEYVWSHKNQDKVKLDNIKDENKFIKSGAKIAFVFPTGDILVINNCYHLNKIFDWGISFVNNYFIKICPHSKLIEHEPSSIKKNIHSMYTVELFDGTIIVPTNDGDRFVVE
jgi:hypothetical protein